MNITTKFKVIKNMKTENRLKNNLEILQLLKDFSEEHPYLRFEQILFTLCSDIDFYAEPEKTLQKIKEKIEKLSKSHNA